MDFACPNCTLEGKIADDRVPSAGIYATCPRCKERFLIEKSVGSLDTSLEIKQSDKAEDNKEEITVADICPSCNYVSQDGCKFNICPKCGLVISKYYKYKQQQSIEIITNMIYCHICHKKLSINATKCPSCGEPSLFNTQKPSLITRNNIIVITLIIASFSIIMLKLNKLDATATTNSFQNNPPQSTPKQVLSPTVTQPINTNPPQQNFDNTDGAYTSPPRLYLPRRISKYTPRPADLPPVYDIPSPPVATFTRPPPVTTSTRQVMKKDFSVNDIEFLDFDAFWSVDGIGRKYPKIKFKIKNVTSYSIGQIDFRLVVSDNNNILFTHHGPGIGVLSSQFDTSFTYTANNVDRETLKYRTLDVKLYVKHNNIEELIRSTTLPYDKVY